MSYWFLFIALAIYWFYQPIKQSLTDFAEWYRYYIGMAIVEKTRFESDPRLQRLLRNLKLREETHNGKTYLGLFDERCPSDTLYVQKTTTSM